MVSHRQPRCGRTCPTCADIPTRRNSFRLLAAIGMSVGLAPVRNWAQKPAYEAMLLSCIDPRLVDPVHNYMNARGLEGKYSQFTIAGAAIAVEANAFAAWRQTFWDNLATSIELHKIKRVIAIDHRDCGAARIAFGLQSVANASAETDTHKRVLAGFRKDVQRRHPGVRVETGLMALDGSIEMFTYRRATACSQATKSSTIWVREPTSTAHVAETFW
jgi:carbonic anhydrase